MIDVLEVVVMAAISFLFGMLWYSPSVFGKQWAKMVGIKMKKKDKPGIGMFISALVISFIMFAVLNYFMNLFAITGILGGMSIAATLWLGFMAPKELNPVLWQKKPFRLFLINGVHDLIMMLVASIIFVLW